MPADAVGGFAMPVARRQHRITWMLSGVVDKLALPDSPPYTQLLTLACPDDFFAVRVGLPNVTDRPWSLSRIIARPSTTWSDYVNPTGDAEWTQLGFAQGGADVEAIATGGEAPAAIEVAPNRVDPASGETMNPAWTWTDWTALRSLPRADAANGPRVLMLRLLLPQGQTITRAIGSYPEYMGNHALHRGFDYAIGKVNSDQATAPEPIHPARANLGHGEKSLACVQFLTRNPGIVAMTTGDSHNAGTATTAQLANYLLQLATALGSRYVGTVPFGYANCATGGAESQKGFPRLIDLLPAIRPSFVVLPGWTYNERHRGVHADAAACDIFQARLLQAAEACLAAEAVPIFLTPFPRNAADMTAVQVGPWLRLRNAALARRLSGAAVADATAVLGRMTDGQFDGTYLPGYTNDQVHPNDAGHAAVAELLSPLVSAICRLG